MRNRDDDAAGVPQRFDSVPEVQDNPGRPDLSISASIDAQLSEEGCADVVPAPLPG